MRKFMLILIALFAMMVVSAAEIETHGTETLVQEKVENTNAYVSNIMQKYDVNKYFKMSYQECKETFGFTKEDAEDYNVFVYFDANDTTKNYTAIVFEENEVKFICYTNLQEKL